MWTREHFIDTAAAPATVWTLFEDVAGWHRWNAGILQVELHGPFATGSRFTMRTPDGGEFTSTLVEVRRERCFVDETVVDTTRVVVEHRLEARADGGTRIRYRTQVDGASADPDAEHRAIGEMVTADFPEVLAALKAAAERRTDAIGSTT